MLVSAEGALGGEALPLDVVTCNSDLGACSTDLGTCNGDLGTCNTGLGTCNTDLGACSTDLTECDGDLAACTATLGTLATGETTSYGTGSDGDSPRGVARSFTDNGDGTITDDVTGLMWEKKSDDGSYAACMFKAQGKFVKGGSVAPARLRHPQRRADEPIAADAGRACSRTPQSQ